MNAGAANHERLRGCGGPHRFLRQANPRLNLPPTYVCTACSGTVTPAGAEAYLDGIRAGKRRAAGVEGELCVHKYRRVAGARYGSPPTSICDYCGEAVSPARAALYHAGLRHAEQMAGRERDGGDGASEAPHVADRAQL